MQIGFEPSGTHVHKGQLKVRLDLFPDPTDKAYSHHYVYVPVIPDGATEEQLSDRSWIASLPHIWKLNPCLSLFVAVDQNINKQILTEWVRDTLNGDVLTTIDDAIIHSNSVHMISPFMRDKSTLLKAKTPTFDDQIRDGINNRLKGLLIASEKGQAREIEPQSLDIGSAAIDRNTNATFGYTFVNLGNPSNGIGYFDTVELWYLTDATGVKCGTFSGTPPDFDDRDFEAIGNVTSGSKQTFNGLNIDALTGDYIGVYHASGSIEKTDTGEDGLYYLAGDHFSDVSNTYTLLSGDAISAYATGVETSIVVTPGTLALTLTTHTPVTGGGVIPGTLALTLTTHTPVTGGGVIPGTLALTITPYAPIAGLGPMTCTPGTLALTITPYAPVIGWVIIPGTETLTLTTHTPTIGVHKLFVEPYRVEIHDSSGNLLAMLENAFDVGTMGSVNELGAAKLSLPLGPSSSISLFPYVFPIVWSETDKSDYLTYGNQLWIYKNGTLQGKYLIRQIEKARE